MATAISRALANTALLKGWGTRPRLAATPSVNPSSADIAPRPRLRGCGAGVRQRFR
ncbi:hypothetical protein ACFPRL_02445 [Pseudoclavibacter helvolus]